MSAAPVLHRVRDRGSHAARLGVKRLRQRLAPVPPSARQTVLVTGMQRSGTNMIMDVLERRPETDVFHERDPRAFDNYQMRELAVIRDLHRRSRARFFVVKALCEADRIGGLLDTFAPARAIWMLRRVDDVVHSAVRSFRNFPAQVERLARGGEAWDWRGRGMSEQTRAHLARLYHPELSEPSAAALLWYVRNVLFFEGGLEDDPRVLVVPYERLVREPAAQLAEVFGFLDIGYSPRFAGDVSPAPVGRHGPAPLEPGVRALCEALEARFARQLPAAGGVA